MYYVTGGMPEPVLMWTEARDVSAMQEALSGIIGAYERDFAKHPNISEFPKISMIWKSIPSQLARENKKFIYKVVKEGARAREYEDALQWLVDARLVHKIYRSTAPGLPVAAYDDLSAFKIYLVDVGLLRRLAQLAPTAFGEGNRLFTEFKGALTENFVLQTRIIHLMKWISSFNGKMTFSLLRSSLRPIPPARASRSLRSCSRIKSSSVCGSLWII